MSHELAPGQAPGASARLRQAGRAFWSLEIPGFYVLWGGEPLVSALRHLAAGRGTAATKRVW
jgi:hypothetical protein